MFAVIGITRVRCHVAQNTRIAVDTVTYEVVVTVDTNAFVVARIAQAWSCIGHYVTQHTKDITLDVWFHKVSNVL